MNNSYLRQTCKKSIVQIFVYSFDRLIYGVTEEVQFSLDLVGFAALYIYDGGRNLVVLLLRLNLLNILIRDLHLHVANLKCDGRITVWRNP